MQKYQNTTKYNRTSLPNYRRTQNNINSIYSYLNSKKGDSYSVNFHKKSYREAYPNFEIRCTNRKEYNINKTHVKKWK